MFAESTCEALNASGLPCQMPPMIGESWCFAHHPDTREAAHDARKRGGERSRGSDASPAPDHVDVTSLPGRFEVLEHTLRDTMQQPNTPARSRAVAALLRLAHDMDLQAEETEIREQLHELARLVDQQEQQRGSYGY
jgi:hypothetical protein